MPLERPPRPMPTEAMVPCIPLGPDGQPDRAQALTRLPPEFLDLPPEKQNEVLLQLRALDRAAMLTCEARRARLERRVRTDQ